eukprot:786336-Rhodomonas_salina.1
MSGQVLSLGAVFGNARDAEDAPSVFVGGLSILGGQGATTSPTLRSARSPGNLSQASTPRPLPVRAELAEAVTSQIRTEDERLVNFGALLPHR